MKLLTHLGLLFVFLALFMQSSLSFAVVITPTPGTELFEKKALLKTIDLTEDDKAAVNLKAVSHGLRKKTVFGLVSVNVYIMELLAANPEKFIKDEAGILGSLQAAGPLSLRLTFLRDLSGEKISTSFKDGLAANGIDTKNLSKELNQVLKEITNFKEFSENNTFSITVSWTGETATVYLVAEGAKIVSINGPKAFAEQLLSIWLGKPADSGLRDLKKALLK